MSTVEKLIRFITRIGVDPADDPDTRLQKTLMVLCSVPFSVAGLAWGGMYFWLGVPVAGSIPFGYAVLSIISLVLFGLTRRYPWFRGSQLLLILFLPFFLMIALGGFFASSAVIVWSVICPLGAMLFDKPKNALRWFLAYLALLGISGFIEPDAADPVSLPRLAIDILFVLNLGAVSGIIFFMVYYFVH